MSKPTTKVLLALDNGSNGAGDQAAAALIPALQSFGARPARLRPYRQTGATKSDWNGMMREGNYRAWLSGRIAQIESFQWR